PLWTSPEIPAWPQAWIITSVNPSRRINCGKFSRDGPRRRGDSVHRPKPAGCRRSGLEPGYSLPTGSEQAGRLRSGQAAINSVPKADDYMRRIAGVVVAT